MAKNILFLAPSLPVGGSEIFLVNLVNGVDRSVIRPVFFSLGSERDPLYERIAPDVPKFVHGRTWRYDLSPADSIASVVSQHNIQTAFCLSFFTWFYMRRALKKARRYSVRTVISLHTTKPRDLKEYFQTVGFTSVLSGAEELITVCENQRRYLVRLYGLDDHLVGTIHNGIDTSRWTLPPASFDRKRERARLLGGEAAGVPDDALIILSVAELRKEKRHDLMVEALARLSRSLGRPVRLLCVGADTSGIGEGVMRLARKLGVADKILLAGVQQDVRPFYWISDIFTLASTSVEAFSLAALEAMASGLPGVLTDVGGAGEMISEGLNGFLVKPGSASGLAAGWERCLGQIPRMPPERVREFIVSRFDLRTCIGQYQRLLAWDDRRWWEEELICHASSRGAAGRLRRTGRRHRQKEEAVA